MNHFLCCRKGFMAKFLSGSVSSMNHNNKKTHTHTHRAQGPRAGDFSLALIPHLCAAQNQKHHAINHVRLLGSRTLHPYCNSTCCLWLCFFFCVCTNVRLWFTFSVRASCLSLPSIFTSKNIICRSFIRRVTDCTRSGGWVRTSFFMQMKTKRCLIAIHWVTVDMKQIFADIIW